MALVTHLNIRDGEVVPAKLSAVDIYSLSGLSACQVAIGANTVPARGCLDINSSDSSSAYFGSTSAGGNSVIILKTLDTEFLIKNEGTVLNIGTSGGTGAVCIPCLSFSTPSSAQWQCSGSVAYYDGGPVGINACNPDTTFGICADGGSCAPQIGVWGRNSATNGIGGIQFYGCDDAAAVTQSSYYSNCFTSIAAGAECSAVVIQNKVGGSLETGILIGPTIVCTPKILCSTNIIYAPTICATTDIHSSSRVCACVCVMSGGLINALGSICAAQCLCSVGATVVGGSLIVGTTTAIGKAAIKQNSADFYGLVIEESASDAWLRMGHDGTNASIHTTYNSVAGATPLVLSTHSITNQICLCTDGQVHFVGNTTMAGAILGCANACITGITCSTCICSGSYVTAASNVCAGQCLCSVGNTCIGNVGFAVTGFCSAGGFITGACMSADAGVQAGVLFPSILRLCNACSVAGIGMNCIVMKHCDNAGATEVYAQIESCVVDSTAGGECGMLLFKVHQAANLCNILTLQHGSATMTGTLTASAAICSATDLWADGIICTKGTGATKNTFAGCISAGQIESSASIVAASGTVKGSAVCATTCIMAGTCICSLGAMGSGGSFVAAGCVTGAIICGTTAVCGACVLSAGKVLGTNVCATQCLCAVGSVISGNTVCAIVLCASTSITAGTHIETFSNYVSYKNHSGAAAAGNLQFFGCNDGGVCKYSLIIQTCMCGVSAAGPCSSVTFKTMCACVCQERMYFLPTDTRITCVPLCLTATGVGIAATGYICTTCALYAGTQIHACTNICAKQCLCAEGDICGGGILNTTGMVISSSTVCGTILCSSGTGMFGGAVCAPGFANCANNPGWLSCDNRSSGISGSIGNIYFSSADTSLTTCPVLGRIYMCSSTILTDTDATTCLSFAVRNGSNTTAPQVMVLTHCGFCTQCCMKAAILCAGSTVLAVTCMASAILCSSGATISGTCQCALVWQSAPCITASACMCVGVAPSADGHVVSKCYMEANAGLNAVQNVSIDFTSATNCVHASSTAITQVTVANSYIVSKQPSGGCSSGCFIPFVWLLQCGGCCVELCQVNGQYTAGSGCFFADVVEFN
jgi:hypothetical protein